MRIKHAFNEVCHESSSSSEELVRFFRAPNMPLIIATIYAECYQELGIEIFKKEDIVTVFFKNSLVEKTKEIGFAQLNSSYWFNEFKEHIIQIIEEKRYFLQFSINRTEPIYFLISFLEVLKTFLKIYQFTEFFYTENAFQETLYKFEDFQDIKNRLTELSLIKSEARKFLNSMLLGESSFLEVGISNLSKEVSLPKDLLFQLTNEEICHREIPSSTILEKRKEYNYSMNWQDDELLICYEERQLDYKHENEVDHKPVMLKGKIASHGFYTGTAKIVEPDYLNYNKLPEILASVNEGDVLICESTSPDLYVICQKVGAIVTNQGGLGSHAATLSRELGIPCVVGVAEATTIIQEGNIVEVDAIKGIITVISRS